MKRKGYIPYLPVRMACSVALVMLGLCLVGACGQRSANSVKPHAQESLLPPSPLQLVSIPSYIQAPAAQAAYLATHYWDNYDFGDTTSRYLPQVTTQAFATYIDILSQTDKSTARTAITALLTKVRQEPSGLVYPQFCALFKTYLYDPNSPLRNDELYIPVVEYIVNDGITDQSGREWAQRQLQLMMRNRVGEPATDFGYTLASGAKGTLYQHKSHYTLLLFYNPDCHACETVVAGLQASAIIKHHLANNSMTVLAVYPDVALEIWKNHLHDIPADWINGFDKSLVIQTQQLYDLKAIPSLYLLDKDKKVLLKDAELMLIEEYLQYNSPAKVLR